MHLLFIDWKKENKECSSYASDRWSSLDKAQLRCIKDGEKCGKIYSRLCQPQNYGFEFCHADSWEGKKSFKNCMYRKPGN